MLFVRAKNRVQWVLLGVALAAAATLAAPAGAAPDSIVIIGDSVSDDGKLRWLAPGLAPPAPYYWMGRFSNGPSYAELISDELGVAEDQVFNFAIGGARSGSGDPARPIDALDQVAQAIGRGAVSPNGLAVYFIGANDLSALFEGELPGVTAQAHVVTVIGNVATGIGPVGARGTEALRARRHAGSRRAPGDQVARGGHGRQRDRANGRVQRRAPADRGRPRIAVRHRCRHRQLQRPVR